MENPYTHLARLLDGRMASQAARATVGRFAELGKIERVFKSNQHTVDRVWLKLDNYKNLIKDPMFADFTVKVEIPQASRVIRLYSPVDALGNGGIPSALTRFDFEVQEADLEPDKTVKVHLSFKDELNVGDRVMAMPFNRGQDAVIICKVVAPTGVG